MSDGTENDLLRNVATTPEQWSEASVSREDGNVGNMTDMHEPGWRDDGFAYHAPERPVVRTPNLADALLFLALVVLALLITVTGTAAAEHFHWFGLHSSETAPKNAHAALAQELLIYLLTLAAAVPFFRKAWGKGYLDGLHWHASTAYRLRYRLAGMAVACNVLAMVGNWLLPFPEHAPIDEMFGNTRDAWMLAGLGIVIAPFFEEMVFRGFLLPAVATAWDWCVEKLTNATPRQPDAAGNPAWSMAAMIFSALVVSVPFAMMHSDQVGKAWGPLLLLYCISLILCAVRLVTRSLAASTLAHAAYNAILFAAMFVQTGGFRHMDKL